MKSLIPRIALILLVGIVLVASPASAQLGAVVSNWTPASTTYTGSHHAGITTMGDVTSPLPFIGVTPCRIVDTRGAAGTFGGPALTAGVPRSFPLPTGPCTGIPSQVKAYSLNITATNTAGPGFFLIYPQGGSQPLVSTLNYLAAQTVANAAIVPAGTSGGVTVIAGVSGADLIIDINGYFSPTPGTASNEFDLTNNSGGHTAFFTNLSTTCGATCGLYVSVGSGRAIRGDGVADGGVYGTTGSTANSAFGTRGDSFGGSGRTFGVWGTNSTGTNDTGGVFGQDATPVVISNLIGTAGVRGEGKNGVVGVSQTTNKEIGAVVGLIVNGSGGLGAFGVLGYDFNTAGEFFGNTVATGTKTFMEPDPADPTKVIKYVSLEGPEAGTYFRGTARTVNHSAVITVPEHFRIVTDTDGMTVQLTTVGSPASIYVASEDLNQIVVESNRDVTFHYLVQGVRKAYKDFQVIQNGTDFMPRSPDARMPGGLSPEAQKRLIANGTYNADGTVNMTTAERVGWTKVWADREAQAKANSQNSATQRKAETKEN
jgi:hypothetical protein